LAGLTLVLGAARSGKSAYATDLAVQSGLPVLFVGTAQPRDREMLARIRRHRRSRPRDWRTLEEPLAPVQRALEEARTDETVLLDCLTVWVGNLLHHHVASADHPKAKEVKTARGFAHGELSLLRRLRTMNMIIVSNEVGGGVVPASPLGRIYQDLLGELNQSTARQADNVIYLIAGIPLYLKDAGHWILAQ
jgi:adenosylcobinamide kinase / adenosylcobinamide-phosphate guanylyltransferase